MKLPERFVLTIEGTLSEITRRAVIVPNEIPAMIGYVLTGGEFDPEAFRGVGLRLWVEVDTDGGEP